MEQLGQIIQGDCLEVLPTLPDHSVGMILTDLPYGVTACEWDKVIDLDALWVQFKRLIQPKRAIVLTATQPFTTDLINSNRKWFRYEDIWEKSKPIGFLDANRRPLRTHENILVFCESQCEVYNPQKSIIDPKFVDRRKTFTVLADDTKTYGKRQAKAKTKDDGTRYPTSVVKVASEWEEEMHPTQKPVALFEYLIRTYSNPGDVVLDCTAGSMTTAIAAINTGREYICIEKDPDYHAKGLQRVQEHLAKPKQIDLFSQPQPAPEPEVKQQLDIFGLTA